MNRVFIRYIGNLPLSVKACVTDSLGNFNIYINSALSSSGKQIYLDKMQQIIRQKASSNDFSAESKLETVSGLPTVMDGLPDKAQEAAKKASAKKAAKVDPAKNRDWLKSIKASAEEFSEALSSMGFEEDADQTFALSRVDDAVDCMDSISTLIRQNGPQYAIRDYMEEIEEALDDIETAVSENLTDDSETGMYFSFRADIENAIDSIIDSIMPNQI